MSDIPDPRDPNKKYSYAVLVPEETLTDKWYDVVANIQWSASSSGRARFWINGKLTKDIQGRNMQPGCPVVYFKYGIYRTYLKRNENAKNITAIAYYDGVRLSKSKDGMFSDLVE